MVEESYTTERLNNIRQIYTKLPEGGAPSFLPTDPCFGLLPLSGYLLTVPSLIKKKKILPYKVGNFKRIYELVQDYMYFTFLTIEYLIFVRDCILHGMLHILFLILKETLQEEQYCLHFAEKGSEAKRVCSVSGGGSLHTSLCSCLCLLLLLLLLSHPSHVRLCATP